MKKFILLSIGLLLVFSFVIPCLATPDTKTVVYYFWTNPRCASCKKIEAFTQEAVKENFAKELKNGSIEFKVIDFKQDKSKQKQYGLFTKSVVLSKVKNGKEIKYKNLDKIWTKLNNEADFKKYIKTEIQKFIK